MEKFNNIHHSAEWTSSVEQIPPLPECLQICFGGHSRFGEGAAQQGEQVYFCDLGGHPLFMVEDIFNRIVKSSIDHVTKKIQCSSLTVKVSLPTCTVQLQPI